MADWVDVHGQVNWPGNFKAVTQLVAVVNQKGLQ